MELRELGINPIRADAPAGDDIKYETEYGQLQTEIDKLSIPTASGAGIDWKHVTQMASTILAEKSKNLLVATYLAAALLETQKVEGFITSLTILKDLTETFWDTLFPPLKRTRGRINAFEWWINRADTYFTSSPLPPQKAEHVEAARNGLLALDQAVSDKMENAPNIMQLMECIDRWPIKPEPKPATPVSEQDQGAPGGTTTSSAPSDLLASAQAAPSEITSTQEADRLLASTLKQLIKVADHLLEHEPANPLLYQLIRIGSWLPIDKLPLSENNQTQIPPPQASARASIENNIENRNFNGALTESESRIREYLFWIDLSRFSSEVLMQLGEKYQQAYEAVCLYTATFVKRIPGIEKLTFADGTPFADAQTRTWLKTIALDGSANDSMGLGAGAGDGDESSLSQAMTEGTKLFKDRKVVEALGMFQKPLASARSGRSKFGWRIAMARFLMNIGKMELARPHFDELLHQVDVYKLEEWDPDLTVQALGVVYEGLSGINETKEAANVIFDRIGRISSTAALACLKG